VVGALEPAEEADFGVGLQAAGRRKPTIESTHLLGVIDDLRRQAQRQRMLLPCRVVPTESGQNALQIGLDGERPDGKQILRLGIIRLGIVVADRPRPAAVVGIGIELRPLKTDQRGTGPFRLAAEVEVLLERDRSTARGARWLFAGERRLAEGAINVERASIGGQLLAFLQDQNAPPRLRQSPRRGRSAGTGPDDDVVVAHAHHPPPNHPWPASPSAAAAPDPAAACDLPPSIVAGGWGGSWQRFRGLCARRAGGVG
jgi:hypothetical protein